MLCFTSDSIIIKYSKKIVLTNQATLQKIDTLEHRTGQSVTSITFGIWWETVRAHYTRGQPCWWAGSAPACYPNRSQWHRSRSVWPCPFCSISSWPPIVTDDDIQNSRRILPSIVSISSNGALILGFDTVAGRLCDCCCCNKCKLSSYHTLCHTKIDYALDTKTKHMIHVALDSLALVSLTFFATTLVARFPPHTQRHTVARSLTAIVIDFSHQLTNTFPLFWT